MRVHAAAVIMFCTLATTGGVAQTTPRRPDRLLQAGHAGLVQTLAFSPDGRWIASGGSDRMVVIWNAATGDEVRKLAGHTADVVDVTFSPDSSHLASLASNGNIRVWEVASGSQTMTRNAGGPARHLAYSADGMRWAVAIDAAKEGTNARIEIHDATTGNLLRALSAPWASTTAMTIAPLGQLMASASDEVDESVLQIWDLATGRVVASRNFGGSAFNADGTLLAGMVYSPQTALVISETATGRQVRTLPARNPGVVAFSPDKRTIVVTDSSRPQLTLWSFETGQSRTIDGGMADIGLMAVAFNRDGSELVAAPYSGNSIKTWATASTRETHTMYGQTVVQGIAVSPDGKWIAVGSKDNLALWDLTAGRRVATLWNGAVSDIAFSHDGRWLAANAGTRFPGEMMKVWDMRTRTITADFTFGGGGTPFQALTFVGGAPATTTLGPFSKAWSFVVDGQAQALWSASSPVSASPDGKLLGISESVGGGDVAVWDLQAGRKLTTLRMQALYVITLAFSPDGRWLMTAGEETRPVGRGRGGDVVYRWDIGLWDTATFTKQRDVSFDSTAAICAAFSPDSRLLAVQKSWEGVDLIDVATGVTVGSYAGRDLQPQNHQYSRDDLAFSPDGRTMLQGAQNGVRIWTLPTR